MQFVSRYNGDFTSKFTFTKVQEISKSTTEVARNLQHKTMDYYQYLYSYWTNGHFDCSRRFW